MLVVSNASRYYSSSIPVSNANPKGSCLFIFLGDGLKNHESSQLQQLCWWSFVRLLPHGMCSAQHLAQQRNHNVTIQIVGEKDWHYSPGLGWSLLGSHGREWTLINMLPAVRTAPGNPNTLGGSRGIFDAPGSLALKYQFLPATQIPNVIKLSTRLFCPHFAFQSVPRCVHSGTSLSSKIRFRTQAAQAHGQNIVCFPRIHDSRFDGGMTMAHSSHLTWLWRFCSCSLQSSCRSGSGRSLNRVLRCFSLRPGSVLHPWLQMIWLRQVHRFQRHDGAVQVCSSWTLAFCASSDAWLKPY